MAVDRVPVLKRCRSLDLDPVYLGIDKKSTRKLTRANRKMSEYALQLREKQKSKIHLRCVRETCLEIIMQSIQNEWSGRC